MEKSNKSLRVRVKNACDEYYTTRASIEEEMAHWKDIFRGKRVCCPCDSVESEFVKFFRDNFEILELRSFEHYGFNYKKSRWEFGTMYGPSCYWLQESYNGNRKGVNDIQTGMIASSDIIVTNPPFSIIVDFYRAFKQKSFIMVAPITFISRKGVYDDIAEIWAGYTKPDCSGPRPIKPTLMWIQNICPVSREVPFKNEFFEPDGYLDQGNIPNFDNTGKAPACYNSVFAVPISAFEKLGSQDIEVMGVIARSHAYPKGPTVEGALKFARLLVKYKEA